MWAMAKSRWSRANNEGSESAAVSHGLVYMVTQEESKSGKKRELTYGWRGMEKKRP